MSRLTRRSFMKWAGVTAAYWRRGLMEKHSCRCESQCAAHRLHCVPSEQCEDDRRSCGSRTRATGNLQALGIRYHDG